MIYIYIYIYIYINNIIQPVQKLILLRAITAGVLSFSGLIVYMKTFLESDWLRAVQVQGNTVLKKGSTVICTELSCFGQ